MPLLSVVVPFHSVERFIDACLESLRRQTLTDLEVVLVDDGSRDGTRDRVERVCAADSRFRVVSQENQGPGPARNNGIAHANGEYLAFVDGDDVVHLDAYRQLVGALAETGSDLAVGNAGRFNNLGISSSYVHQVAITGNSARTHITRQPELVLDRMAWNKVYRRDFWNAHELTFPALLMGEDFPVSIAAHCQARAVDVLDTVFYFWRERDGGEPSITQRSAELSNLDDRLASAMKVLDVVEGQAPDSASLLRHHFMDIDVTAVLAALTVHDAADHAAILDRAARLVDRLGPEAAADLPPFYRVQLALLDRRDADALIDLHRWSHRYGRGAAVVRQGRLRRRYYQALPFLGEGRVPDEAFLVPGAPEVAGCVEEAFWDGDVLVVRGLIESPVALGPRSKVTAWLEAKNGRRVPLELDRHPRQRPFLGEDLVGFALRIDPRVVETAGGGAKSFWALRLKIESKDVSGEYDTEQPSFQQARFVRARPFPGRPELQVQPYRGGRGFGLQVREPRVLLTGCRPEADRLLLTGTLADPTESVILVLSGRHGVDRTVPVDVHGDAFSVAVPAELLAETPDYLTPAATQWLYDAYFDLGESRRPVALGPEFTSATVRRGHRAVIATRGFSGNLQLVEERIAPVLRRVSWVGASTLLFEGSWPGEQELPAEVVLEHFEHPADRVDLRVPLSADGDRYRFEVDAAELVRIQREERDPYDGPHPPPWHLVLPFADHIAPQVCDRDALGEFAEARIVQDYRVAVTAGRGDVVRIRIGD